MKEEIKTKRGDGEGWFWKVRVHHWVSELIDFDILLVKVKQKQKALERNVVWETFDPSLQLVKYRNLE